MSSTSSVYRGHKRSYQRRAVLVRCFRAQHRRIRGEQFQRSLRPQNRPRCPVRIDRSTGERQRHTVMDGADEDGGSVIDYYVVYQDGRGCDASHRNIRCDHRSIQRDGLWFQRGRSQLGGRGRRHSRGQCNTLYGPRCSNRSQGNSQGRCCSSETGPPPRSMEGGSSTTTSSIRMGWRSMR